eukprot:6373805-Amphidinium_carterae.2
MPGTVVHSLNDVLVDVAAVLCSPALLLVAALPEVVDVLIARLPPSCRLALFVGSAAVEVVLCSSHGD